MLEAERRIRALGYHSIALGAPEGAEDFYEKLGYTGSLLIQQEKCSIDELKSLNQEYEVIWTNVYEERINQICLRVRSVDREFQRRCDVRVRSPVTVLALMMHIVVWRMEEKADAYQNG